MLNLEVLGRFCHYYDVYRKCCGFFRSINHWRLDGEKGFDDWKSYYHLLRSSNNYLLCFVDNGSCRTLFVYFRYSKCIQHLFLLHIIDYVRESTLENRSYYSVILWIRSIDKCSLVLYGEGLADDYHRILLYSFSCCHI